jgi:hypothetical protein
LPPAYTAVLGGWDFSVLPTTSMIRRGAGETRQTFPGQMFSVFNKMSAAGSLGVLDRFSSEIRLG